MKCNRHAVVLIDKAECACNELLFDPDCVCLVSKYLKIYIPREAFLSIVVNLLHPGLPVSLPKVKKIMYGFSELNCELELHLIQDKNYTIFAGGDYMCFSHLSLVNLYELIAKEGI